MFMRHSTDAGHASCLGIGIAYFVPLGFHRISRITSRKILPFQHSGICLGDSLVKCGGFRTENKRLHHIACVIDKNFLGILDAVNRQSQFLECLFIFINEFPAFGHIISKSLPRTLQFIICRNLGTGAFADGPGYAFIDFLGSFKLCLAFLLGLLSSLIPLCEGIQGTDNSHNRHREQHVRVCLGHRIESCLCYCGRLSGNHATTYRPCADCFGGGGSFGLYDIDALHEGRLFLKIDLH